MSFRCFHIQKKLCIMCVFCHGVAFLDFLCSHLIAFVLCVRKLVDVMFSTMVAFLVHPHASLVLQDPLLMGECCRSTPKHLLDGLSEDYRFFGNCVNRVCLDPFHEKNWSRVRAGVFWMIIFLGVIVP